MFEDVNKKHLTVYLVSIGVMFAVLGLSFANVVHLGTFYFDVDSYENMHIDRGWTIDVYSDGEVIRSIPKSDERGSAFAVEDDILWRRTGSIVEALDLEGNLLGTYTEDETKGIEYHEDEITSISGARYIRKGFLYLQSIVRISEGGTEKVVYRTPFKDIAAELMLSASTAIFAIYTAVFMFKNRQYGFGGWFHRFKEQEEDTGETGLE